ncbi:MAG: tetratricopeptide repeat protein [Candidatus Electrothrix aestuarii]|uniref:Tetratricopeptide repeat protein n=1 Tax=Candidatus Electrothrix aestuarii TaxID=3062594 RepID=A0AAU8LVJ2_9BACT|nr:tetratricopeptide repeat protein [Candidatus Electrothrix aestuarii]
MGTTDNIFNHSGDGEQNIGQGDRAIGKQVNNYYPPPPVIPRQLPPLDACFLGRDEELAMLLEQLQPGKVVAVCGPGGMGKSALAAQAVSKLEESRFPDGIVFHSFYGHPETELALQAVCTAFQVEAKAGLAGTVRQVLAGRKALLILDGAEEADDLYAVLRLRGQCGVLITSRKNEDAPDEPLELQRLEEQQAKEVFQRYSGLAINDASVRGICKILDGWPVALRIAGRYLRITKENAADYLKDLEKEPFKELGSGKHEQENITLLLRRSVAQVSEDARLTLGVAGTLAFAPIAREPVAHVLNRDERRARKALGELVNYGLLEKREERWQISHRMVHTYTRTELALSSENLERLAQAYIQVFHIASRAGLSGYAFLDRERAHCPKLLESCFANKLWQEVKGLVGEMWVYLDRQGWWTELLAAFEMNLTAAREAGDRKDEGVCLNNLGYICERRGELDKALAWHNQCLPIYRELDDREGEGTTLNNMASIYRQQGMHELALETYQQSLSISREIGDRMGEGSTLNNIGLLYMNQGDNIRALEHYEQALPIMRELGYKIGESTIRHNIAMTYHAQSDHFNALEYNKQAVAIRRDWGDRPGEAVSCWNIGRIYENLGELPEAEEHISLAVEITKAIGHPSLRKYREGLARVRAARQGV